MVYRPGVCSLSRSRQGSPSAWLGDRCKGFYISDERGRLRKHVAIWVNGDQIEDREGLTDALAEDARVTILQALSGG